MKAEALPDIKRCQARPAPIGDLAYCLVPLPHDCPWVEMHREKAYCFHPERKKIITKTQFGPASGNAPH
jgi:hypothetical protein